MNDAPKDRSLTPGGSPHATIVATTEMETHAPTAEQLRGEIDSGATHDKVAHSDPAAAPLGTDDEAAGTPPTAEQVALARRHETTRRVRDPSPADQPAQRGMAPSRGFVWAIVAALVILIVLGIALSW